MRQCLHHKAARQVRESLIPEVTSHPGQMIRGTVRKESEQVTGSKQANEQHSSADSPSVLASKFSPWLPSVMDYKL